MREKQVIESKGHTVPHHLPLSSLSTVKEERFAFAVDGEATDATIDGWAGG